MRRQTMATERNHSNRVARNNVGIFRLLMLNKFGWKRCLFFLKAQPRRESSRVSYSRLRERVRVSCAAPTFALSPLPFHFLSEQGNNVSRPADRRFCLHIQAAV